MKNPFSSQTPRNVLLKYYIAYCIAILITIIILITVLIHKNNVTQTQDTLTMMAEKVNDSFDMMTSHVDYLAKLMSARENLNLSDCYQELLESSHPDSIASIGIISANGPIYGNPGEQLDFSKQHIQSNIREYDHTVVSEPYRSSVTGSNVITFFSPIYQEDSLVGCLFVTYLLESLQHLADTSILETSAETFLMNAYSGNYVTCTSSEDRPTGTWGNIRLVKKELHDLQGTSYNTWEDAMRNGDEKNNIFCYQYQGVTYTQAYIALHHMDDWFILVRIPNHELSSTMNMSLLSVSICAFLLLGGTIAFALQLYLREIRQKRNLQVISSQDPLTQVMNRRAFEEMLSTTFEDARSDSIFTFIYLDIDDFKSINDNYGHDTGDQILVGLSSALRSVFIPNGYIARIGGDEFNIFFPKPISISELEELMTKLHNKLKKVPLKEGISLEIHISAGIAQYPFDADDLESLREHADKALYYVKEQGKNNHCWYKDISTP